MCSPTPGVEFTQIFFFYIALNVYTSGICIKHWFVCVDALSRIQHLLIAAVRNPIQHKAGTVMVEHIAA